MKRAFLACAAVALGLGLVLLALEVGSSAEAEVSTPARPSSAGEQRAAGDCRGAAEVVAGSAGVEPAGESTRAAKLDDPYGEAEEDLADGRAILVDVRELDEWDSGHLRGAIIFPVSWLREYESGARPNTIPEEKIVYVYGRSRQNARRAAALLADMGFDARPFAHGLEELAGRFEIVR